MTGEVSCRACTSGLTVWRDSVTCRVHHADVSSMAVYSVKSCKYVVGSFLSAL